MLAAEQRLRTTPAGLGWAKDIVGNLCLDNSGDLMQTCERDGERENYLAPRDHRSASSCPATVPPGAACSWTSMPARDRCGRTKRRATGEIMLRVPYGRITVATVDIPLGDGTAQRVVAEIAVRDVLIAGLGRFHRCRRRQSG